MYMEIFSNVLLLKDCVAVYSCWFLIMAASSQNSCFLDEPSSPFKVLGSGGYTSVHKKATPPARAHPVGTFSASIWCLLASWRWYSPVVSRVTY